MNQDNYSKITIKGTFKAANWQELVDLFSDMYNPLSLRTFNGSANPLIADVYTRTHWDSSENKMGFGESLIRNATNNWIEFKFTFYDKDDENRFIKINVNCKNKTVEISASLDNEKKLKNATKEIETSFSSFHFTSVTPVEKNDENKRFAQQDKVGNVVRMARNNPVIASIIIVCILIISLGTVCANFEHMATFFKKYTAAFDQKSDISKSVITGNQKRVVSSVSHEKVRKKDSYLTKIQLEQTKGIWESGTKFKILVKFNGPYEDYWFAKGFPAATTQVRIKENKENGLFYYETETVPYEGIIILEVESKTDISIEEFDVEPKSDDLESNIIEMLQDE